MLSVEKSGQLLPFIGQELEPSLWIEITEAMILAFAEVTRERHWIHTDAARVRAETPFKGLVAHGFLTLSLMTSLAGQCVEIRGARRILNYGLDRVRFTDIVTAGDRLRLRLTLESVEPGERGTRLKWRCTLESEGRPRPALVADFIWAVEET